VLARGRNPGVTGTGEPGEDSIRRAIVAPRARGGALRTARLDPAHPVDTASDWLMRLRGPHSTAHAVS